MTHDHDRYRDWKRRRTQAEVPADFADRVMRAVAAREPEPPRHSAAGALLFRLLASRAARVGICAAAAVVCAVRIWSVLALFVSELPVTE